MAFLSADLAKRFRPWSVWALYVVGLLPAAWYFYQGATGQLGADPVKTFERLLGIWALRFIILTLCVTPLRDLAGFNSLRYRRALGLIAFYYVVMHFSVYLILDQHLDLNAVLADIVKRPFITIGMACLVLLIPLAVTSNAFSIKRLGRNWNRLHKLMYVIAAGAALHFALSVKVITTEPAIYIGLVILLLGYRLIKPFIPKRKRGRRGTGNPGNVVAQ